MIALDSGDKIRGDASAAAVVDYTIHGLDANAIKQLADGQLIATIGDLFTADSADAISSIILVNTDSSARTVNLYLTPSGGAARRLIPKDMSLGVGYSLHFDGAHVLIVDTAGGVVSSIPANQKELSITFIIDGGVAAITTGEKGHLEIPFACTIDRVTTLADQSGSIVVDIWKDTYANFPPDNDDSITASAPPTLSGAQKAQDSTLTGWTTSIAAGDILAFNVDSITDCQRVMISLKVTRA